MSLNALHQCSFSREDRTAFCSSQHWSENRIHVRSSRNVVNPAWVGWVFWVDHVGHRGLIWTGVATEVEAGRLQLLQLWPMQ